MSYDAIENSIDRGEPVNLFEFIYGDGQGDVYRYASFAALTETVTFAGKTWEPAPIRHGDITNTGGLDRSNVDISMPVTLEIVKMFRVAPPSRPVQVRIWRGHPFDDDFKLIWSGRALGPKWEDNEVTFAAEPVSTSLLRIGLRRFYQYGCPHVLYGPMCKADRAAHTAKGVVDSTPSTILVAVDLQAPLNDVGAGTLVGGVFRLTLPDGRRSLRSIIAASPGAVAGRYVLRLMTVMPELADGMPVEVSMGCAHNFQVCRDRFNNTPNYGGFPNIPTKNPFQSSQF